MSRVRSRLYLHIQREWIDIWREVPVLRCLMITYINIYILAARDIRETTVSLCVKGGDKLILITADVSWKYYRRQIHTLALSLCGKCVYSAENSIHLVWLSLNQHIRIITHTFATLYTPHVYMVYLADYTQQAVNIICIFFVYVQLLYKYIRNISSYMHYSGILVVLGCNIYILLQYIFCMYAVKQNSTAST